MAEPSTPVLSYGNPQTDPPPGSRISVEQDESGIIVEAPGPGAARFASDFAAHFVFTITFAMILLGMGAERANYGQPALGYFLIPVGFLTILVISFIRLVAMATEPTHIVMRDGRLTITRPLGGAVERPLATVDGFRAPTAGISLTLRAFGSLRLYLSDGGRAPITLLKRYYHAEVVWLAQLLNEEMVRQRAKTP